jgi:hypothetical protein
MCRATLPLWLLLAACAPSASANPPQFWLTLNGSELMLRLTPVEPPEF